jgi:glycosyltransferase involved in cell wall biosynthesis
LAKRGIQVVSTYGPEGVTWPQTLMVIGKQDAVCMRDFVMQASVYLSTTKETFGIGTLEAMACGVPVVGWDYGGTSQIVTSGYDGILVKPGDYDALEAAVHEAKRRRIDFGKNARETARRYDWSNVIRQYARLYEMVLAQKRNEQHGVSVIVTNYNYGAFVGEAIKSVMLQTRPADEIIVVDDGSTDESPRIILATLQATQPNQKCQFITQANQGVAAARTAGIAASSQPYLVCLDADDRLAPEFIETLLPVIDARRDLGIVYSGITMFNDTDSWHNDGWPPPFDWDGQTMPHNPPSNCIPAACMFRKDMWYRAGPHRQEYAPGEDAEFWTRGLSVGFTAQRVTDAGLFWYRLHGESASRVKKYKAIDDRLPWMRDKQYPFAAPAKVTPVRSYSDPKVSVIIPVGPGHENTVIDAIESLLAQTMREWECVVVDDTGLDSGLGMYLLGRYPFAKVLLNQQAPGGPGLARNAGLEQAAAPLVVYLDADDMLVPTALEEMLIAHVNSGGRYIYTDTLRLSKDGTQETIKAADYKQHIWRDDGLHSVTALIPIEWARATRFNPKLKTWEEGDFYTRMAIAGYCGQHLERPLLIWRDWTGTRHAASKAKRAAALRHQKQFEGVEMGSCCGGDGGAAIIAAKEALSGMTIKAAPINTGLVRMEFIGDQFGPITFFGSKGKEYRGGKEIENHFAEVLAEDVKRLELSGKWQVVATF